MYEILLLQELFSHVFFLLGELWTEAEDIKNSFDDFSLSLVYGKGLLEHLLFEIEKTSQLESLLTWSSDKPQSKKRFLPFSIGYHNFNQDFSKEEKDCYLVDKICEVLDRYGLALLKVYGIHVLQKEFEKAVEIVEKGIVEHTNVLNSFVLRNVKEECVTDKKDGDGKEKDDGEGKRKTLMKLVKGRLVFLEDKLDYVKKKVSAKKKVKVSVEARRVTDK